MGDESPKNPKSSPKSRHGGSRPNAGRKTKEAKILKQQVDNAIAGRLDQILENMFRLADGIHVQDEKDGAPVVYLTPPDRLANIYLIDRLLGKPAQAINFNSMSDADLLAFIASRLGGTGGPGTVAQSPR